MDRLTDRLKYYRTDGEKDGEMESQTDIQTNRIKRWMMIRRNR